MTTAVQPDIRGVEGLSGEVDMEVECGYHSLIWQQVVAELGPLPDAPVVDPFDEAPWVQQAEQVEGLWQEPAPLESLIYQLAFSAHRGRGVDLVHYLAQQWGLADKELALARMTEVRDGAGECAAVDDRTVGGDGAVGAVVAGGGGGDVSGGFEDGDQVGVGEEVAVDPNPRRSSKVSRKRRSATVA